MISDTICAISTPYGTGGISVIRVTGSEAIEKVNKIFKGTDLVKQKSHTICHGFIMDSDFKTIDEVLISLMRAPKSFTSEDTVEISTHGGILVTQKVLSRVLSTGIRLAERGEFTQRAFLNGKIDLIQAESINDLIHARNDISITIANQGIGNKTSSIIKDIRNYILSLIAQIEVNIDYPEYDDAKEMTNNIIIPNIEGTLSDINGILKYSKKTMMIKEGIDTVIIGKPNVGKSSLLNALLNEEKAIVTDIAGTTRDLIEASINLGEITLNLIDTAGIRDTDDKIEKIGVDKTRKAIEKAELILLLLDQSKPLEKIDYELLELIRNKNAIVIKNKADLKDEISLDNTVSVSSVMKTGLKELELKIMDLFALGVMQYTEYNYLSSARQIGKLESARESLQNAIRNKDMPIDIIGIDLTNTYMHLSEILGEEYQENLLNELFTKFCLGK